MDSFRGISIDIVRNNRVGTAATISYCATDMIVNVWIDSYLGPRYSLKIIRCRVSLERYLFITIDRYLSIKAVGLQLYR